MKILMVNNSLVPIGGVERYMISLSEQLTIVGHEVQFFGMFDEKKTVGNNFNIYTTKTDLKSKSMKKYLLPLKVIYSFESRRKLKKLIKLYRPDIIHLQTIYYHITPSIISLIKKLNIPIVQSIHDAYIVCPNHRLFIEKSRKPCTLCVSGNYSNCFKNKCIMDSSVKSLIGSLDGYIHHFTNVYNKVDKYIFSSQFMIDIHKKNGINPDLIELLVNFSRFKSVKIPNEKIFKFEKYVLYFGRLSMEKGIHTLLEAAKKLSYIKFKIAPIGSTDLIKNIELSENVEVLDSVSGDKLYKLIENALFSVYPSEWYENSPLSVLESQALGTPVIGANIGGIPELIQNNVTGLLFESGNKTDFIEKISHLYENETLINEMTSNCLSNARLIDLNHYTRQMINLYENTIYNKNKKETSNLSL